MKLKLKIKRLLSQGLGFSMEIYHRVGSFNDLRLYLSSISRGIATRITVMDALDFNSSLLTVRHLPFCHTYFNRLLHLCFFHKGLTTTGLSGFCVLEKGGKLLSYKFCQIHCYKGDSEYQYYSPPLNASIR